MVQRVGFVVFAAVLLVAAPAVAQSPAPQTTQAPVATPPATATPEAPDAEPAEGPEATTAEPEAAVAAPATPPAHQGVQLSFVAAGGFGPTAQVDGNSGLLKELDLAVLERHRWLRSGVMVNAGQRDSLTVYGASLLAGPSWRINPDDSLDLLLELGVQHFSRSTYDASNGGVATVNGAERTLPYLGLRVMTVHEDGAGLGLGFFAQWTLGDAHVNYSQRECTQAGCNAVPVSGKYGGMAAGVMVHFDYTTWSR